jgi:hypothetical protein
MICTFRFQGRSQHDAVLDNYADFWVILRRSRKVRSSKAGVMKSQVSLGVLPARNSFDTHLSVVITQQSTKP